MFSSALAVTAHWRVKILATVEYAVVAVVMHALGWSAMKIKNMISSLEITCNSLGQYVMNNRYAYNLSAKFNKQGVEFKTGLRDKKTYFEILDKYYNAVNYSKQGDKKPETLLTKDMVEKVLPHYQLKVCNDENAADLSWHLEFNAVTIHDKVVNVVKEKNAEFTACKTAGVEEKVDSKKLILLNYL